MTEYLSRVHVCFIKSLVTSAYSILLECPLPPGGIQLKLHLTLLLINQQWNIYMNLLMYDCIYNETSIHIKPVLRTSFTQQIHMYSKNLHDLVVQCTYMTMYTDNNWHRICCTHIFFRISKLCTKILEMFQIPCWPFLCPLHSRVAT